MTVHVCTPEDMHPYACAGPGKCRHCDRRFIVYTADEGTQSYEHDPFECGLCDLANDDRPILATDPT